MLQHWKMSPPLWNAYTVKIKREERTSHFRICLEWEIRPEDYNLLVVFHKISFFAFYMMQSDWTQNQKGTKWRTDKKMNSSQRNAGILGHYGTMAHPKTWFICSQKTLTKFIALIKPNSSQNDQIRDISGISMQKTERESRSEVNPCDHPCATKSVTGLTHFCTLSFPLFICFAVLNVRVILWSYIKLLRRDSQKCLERDRQPISWAEEEISGQIPDMTSRLSSSCTVPEEKTTSSCLW